MSVIIGSARIDEHGNAHGGSAGDQKQSSTHDYRGEVSMQEFYVSSKGWIVARLKNTSFARQCAKSMETACNNINIGYDQYQRDGIWSKGTATKTRTECDCSSLVRRCIFEATGKDVGNIRTITMESALKKSGLFEDLKQYKAGMTLCTGDVLFTGQLGHPVSGHTVIVVKGATRSKAALPTLKRGDVSGQVKKLQKNLNKLGIKDDNGKELELDGDFGPKTGQSLKRFQKVYKLEIDEIYGPKSFAAMEKALA